VPMREVTLTNGEAIALYDTSGPYTEPSAMIDVRQGLAPLRAGWIEARSDTESYIGRAPQARDDGTKHEAREAERIAALRREAAALQRTPRRAKTGANLSGNVTQMHYARRGIVTP
jgi:phosphomethylpyrimidine synthase